MLEFYDVEVQGDIYEELLTLSREYHDEMWGLIEQSNAGTRTLTPEEDRACGEFLATLFAA